MDLDLGQIISNGVKIQKFLKGITTPLCTVFAMKKALILLLKTRTSLSKTRKRRKEQDRTKMSQIFDSCRQKTYMYFLLVKVFISYILKSYK